MTHTSPSKSTAENGPWTTRRLLAWMTSFLESKSVDSPRLCAEMLLAHVIKSERLRLYMEPDRPAAPDELAALRDLVARAGRHEPIAYLLGQWWFFGMPFEVSQATLIPRPSTETLVEFVIQTVRAARDGQDEKRPLRIADIGTGSGCIAVSLAKNLADVDILASDVSPDALDMAARNAQRHGVRDTVGFVEGPLTAPLDEAGLSGSLDFLISNPPYISDQEWQQVPTNVRDYEPPLALRGGRDGLVCIKPLIESGPLYVRPGGWLVIEIAASQAQAALQLAQNHTDLQEARILDDHECLPRVLIAQRR
ncbi:MAG: peptide chain release factor N(5)-glutamine methyltransferase [Planctomycetes bacterium]|nr:peptide chain release factor N(5)-glutamine methyltransferase [Planctomycetota bacterium]